MRPIKVRPVIMSPVEYAINKANDYLELTKCSCQSCKDILAGISEEAKTVATVINRLRNDAPALCFIAMFEGWTVEKLLDTVRNSDG
jgi:hypothetical protein